MTNYIKKLLALAVVAGAMTAVADTVAYEGDYAKFSYSKIVNWRGTAAAFHNGTVTELQADGSESASYNMTADQGAQSWQRFAENQTAYACPGMVLRLNSSTATKNIEAAFSPWTIGGLIIEEAGYTLGPSNHNSRGVCFGDPSGETETYMDIHESFTINRGSTEANFKNGFFGTVNLTIDEGKVFNYNAAQSAHALYVHTQWTRKSTAVASHLKMHGEGTLKVATLTATGDVTLDFSDLGARANATPFIDGNLTLDDSTRIVFPAAIGSGVPMRLCSGTLNYSGEDEYTTEVQIGDTIKTATIQYDVSNSSVKYILPVEDGATPVLLLNVYDTSHSEVTGWLNHTQTKDTTDSPKIPKNGDYLGTADGVHFSTSSGGNFFNNHITANTDFETGTYVDIFGGEHETLAEEVATSLGLPEGTVFDANVYKSGVMNGGVHGHTATIANLDTTKTYVVYIGTGLLKSDNTGSNSGIGISASSFDSVRSIDYVMTVDGAGGTKQPNYQSIDAGSAVTPSKNGVLVMRLVDVVPKSDGTITFTLGGDRSGLNFLAVSEVTRSTPTKLTATLSGEKGWSDLTWTSDGKTQKWINGVAAEIEVTDAATLTLDPTVDAKSIKFIGSAALTLTTTDGEKPDAEFLAKLKLGDYAGMITYGWNASPTVIAINFNATANDNGDGGGSDAHKLGENENADILGMNIFGSQWSQFTVRTQGTPETVTAYNTETGATVGSAIVTWRSDNVYMYRNSEDKVIRGYLDDGGQHASVTLASIPFDAYDLIIVSATDQGSRRFNPVTVNGTAYYWDSELNTTVPAPSAASVWGQCQGAHVEYGRNAIKLSQQTAKTLTITGGANANGARGGIAAILLVESEAQAIEIIGDTTLADLAEKMTGLDEAVVMVKANAAITQNGTLPCSRVEFRAETPATLSFELNAAQLAAVEALAPNSTYDVATAIFGFKPSVENVTIAITNVPANRQLITIGGLPMIVRGADEPIFTPANETDWADRTLPSYAKTVAATGNTSFAGDVNFLQTIDSREITAAVVTTAPANALLYGLHAFSGSSGIGEITRDVYLKVSGGTPAVVSGGEDANWSGTKTIPTGNLLVNLTGDTVVDYVYGAGLGGGNDNPLAKIIGNVGVVVDGDAQIKGTLAAGWQSRHNAVPEITGNTSVLIKNVQTHEADATYTAGALDCVQGWILGGGIYKTNNGKCKIGGNSSVTVLLDNNATGTFAKHIAGGGHNVGGGDGVNTLGDSSVTITAPEAVIFAKNIMGGGHSTGTNKAKTGGNSSVTLNGGTYTGTIYAAGDNAANTQVDGAATLTITGGDFTGATLKAGSAQGLKTLDISGGKFNLTSSFAEGFNTIKFSGDQLDFTFPDGWSPNQPVELSCSTMSYNGATSGSQECALDITVGEKTVAGATVVFNLTNHSIAYKVPKEGLLTRRSDVALGIDPKNDDDPKRAWTYPNSWLKDGVPCDWPIGGAAFAVINADEVSSIRVNDRIEATMITLTNTAAQEDEPSFKFLTEEPLDEVADMTKTNPEFVILGQLTASDFRGDLYLQSRITQAITLGDDTHVFFVAWDAAEETTAYPYEFSRMVNPICKVGPGAFIVPSSMYTYAFNVKGGSLIYDIAEGTEATVSGVLQKDTPADPETHFLIKRGLGTMTYTTRLRTGFLDELEIRQGTLKLQSTGDFDFVGTSEPLPVTVKSGATLDMNGQTGFAAAVTLEGGATLANSNGEINTGSASLRSITLTGDATVDATARFGLLAIGYGDTVLNLGGFTLTKKGAGAFHLCKTSSDDEGKINVEAGTLHSVHQQVSLPNVDVVLGAGTTFDLGAPMTIGELTLGSTYTFIGNSTLTVNKSVNYVGATDARFTWYAATFAEGATVAVPETPFTMVFGSIPTIPVELPATAKVELEVPNLAVGYVYPITGVAEANVTVKVGGTESTDARVEITSDSIVIHPPLSRYNPVTGEDVGFINAFRGTEDANWATSANWYKGSESAWVQWEGTAPMLPNTADGGFNPALIDGNLIENAERRQVTLATMEGWTLRLGLFNGATATVENLVKIQGEPAYIMVDASSKLNLAAPNNSKGTVINLFVAAEDGLTWTSAFTAADNTLNYYFKDAGSVNYTAGVNAGTHTIKRFDLTIGDPDGAGMQRGIVSKKLVSFGADSAANFTIASDATVFVDDAELHPGLVPEKSAVDALTGNEDLGTYYLAKTDDGVYVKYIGYSTDPEKPLRPIIDQETYLSEFTLPTAGEVIVLGAPTWKEAFDIVFDREVPSGVTFTVNGYVNIKSTDDDGVLAAIPYLTIPESGAGARLFFTTLPDALTVVPNKFIYRVSSDLSSGYQLSKGAATYEFVNARLTNQNGANYKLYVADGDVLSLAGANSPPRTSPSLIVDGGSVTLGASSNNAFWYGGVDGQTTYVQTAGRVEVPVVGTETSGSGSGLLLGFSGNGLAMSISGGELLVPNSSLNFWVCPQVNLSGTGYVKAKGVFKGSNNGAVTISENAVFDLGSIGWQGIVLNLNGGKLNAFENATISVPMTIADGGKLGASAGAELIVAQPISAAGQVVIEGPGMVTLNAGSVADTDVFKVASGVLNVGLARPIVNVLDGGKVKLMATKDEIEAGELVLKVPEDAASGGTDKIEVVDGTGSSIRVKDVQVDPDAHTVTILLGTATINESISTSAINEMFSEEGGVIAVIGSEECLERDAPGAVVITFDEELAANIAFTITRHVCFVATGSISTIPVDKFTIAEGGCLRIYNPLSSNSYVIPELTTLITAYESTAAMTFTNNGTLKTEKNIVYTLTANNGATTVTAGGEATVTASGSQAIKGTLEVAYGAVLKNLTSDAISYGTPGTTVNVHGTLDMGESRWTVGGASTINLYGDAMISGTGSGDNDSAGVLDFYRSGNMINVFKSTEPGYETDELTATIEGVLRGRDTDAGIWIATGASLALPGGINGIVANAKVTLRRGDGHVTGHLTGTIPLMGTITVDLGANIGTVPTRFVAKRGADAKLAWTNYSPAAPISVTDSKTNPFIKVEPGATLAIDGHNYSGPSGEIGEHGWIVNAGSLVFQDGNGQRYFRDHLVLEDGATVAINSGNSKFRLFGGAGAEDSAQIMVSGTTRIGAGVAGDNAAITVEASGAGICVDEGSTLTIATPLTTVGTLTKWGMGTLKVGANRPKLDVKAGFVQLEVSSEETIAGELKLPKPTTSEELTDQIKLVNASGDAVEVTEVRDEGDNVVFVLNRGIVYTLTDYVDITAQGTSTLEDFPVLLRISEEAIPGFTYERAGSNGSELRFYQCRTAAEYNTPNEKRDPSRDELLPFEILEWHPAGESLIWVKINSSLIEADARGKFRMAWHVAPGASAPKTRPVSDIWSAYVGVWHMDEKIEARDAADSPSFDATANELNAVPEPGDGSNLAEMVSYEDGVLGRARVISSTDGSRWGNHLTVADYDSLGVGNTFAFSCWIKFDNYSSWPILASRKANNGANGGWAIEFNNNRRDFVCRGGTGSVNATVFSGTPAPKDIPEFTHIVFAYRDNTLTAYANGAAVSVSGTLTGVTDNGRDLYIGGGYSSEGSKEYSINGKLDEVRIKKGEASAAWALAEYNTMKNPDTFFTFGLVNRPIGDDVEGREWVNYWTVEPSLKHYWKKGELTVADLEAGKGTLKVGAVAIDFGAEVPSELGLYRVEYKSALTVDVNGVRYGYFDGTRPIEIEIIESKPTPVIDPGDLTASGRVLLVNDDAEMDVTGQTADQWTIEEDGSLTLTKNEKKLWTLRHASIGTTFDGETLPDDMNTLPAREGTERAQIILENNLDAEIESGIYTNGVGTIYFDVVNASTNATTIAQFLQLEVQVDSYDGLEEDDVYDDNEHCKVYAMYVDGATMAAPEEGDTVSSLNVDNGGDTTGRNFYRVYVPVNTTKPTKFRLHRVTAYEPGEGQDELDARILIDNVVVSFSAKIPEIVAPGEYRTELTGKAILGKETAFSVNYPAVGDQLTASVKLEGEGVESVSSLRLRYRWRYLNAEFDPLRAGGNDVWKTAFFPVDGSTRELTTETLAIPARHGDVEFYYDMTAITPFYTYVDYAGLGDACNPYVAGYYSEEITPEKPYECRADQTKGLSPAGGTDWFVRLREYPSDVRSYTLVATAATNGTPVVTRLRMEMITNNVYRAFLPTTAKSGFAKGDVFFRFEEEKPTNPGATKLNFSTNYLAATRSDTVLPASLPVDFVSSDKVYSTIPNDGATGYLQFRLDVYTKTLAVFHADYQNFNRWNDAAASDEFVGTSSDNASKSGASRDMSEYVEDFATWTDMSEPNENNAWLERFINATPLREPFAAEVLTPNHWHADHAMYVSETYYDETSDATGRKQDALQLEGYGAGGYLEFRNNQYEIDPLPRGLKSISFSSRLAQTMEFSDIAYKKIDDWQTRTGYTFATQYAMSDTCNHQGLDFDGAAQISLVAGYQPNVGCYEFRVTRQNASTLKRELYKWTTENGVTTARLLVSDSAAANLDFSRGWHANHSNALQYPCAFISLETLTDGSVKVEAGISTSHTTAGQMVQGTRCVMFWDDQPGDLATGSYGVSSANCETRFVSPRTFASPLPWMGGTTQKGHGNRANANFTWGTATYEASDTSTTEWAKDWALAPGGRIAAFAETGAKARWGFIGTKVAQPLVFERQVEGSGSWETLSTFTVDSFKFETPEEHAFYLPENGKYRLRHGGDKSTVRVDIVLDSVEIKQYGGGNFGDWDTLSYVETSGRRDGWPNNTLYTSGWVHDNMVQLSARRTKVGEPCSIRSPLMDGNDGRGIGLGLISVDYVNAQENVNLLVQIATNNVEYSIAEETQSIDPTVWTTITNFDFRVMSPADRRAGTLNCYLGIHGVKGVMRFVMDPELVASVKEETDPTKFGSIDIVRVVTRDEPSLDETSWWGWNLRLFGYSRPTSRWDNGKRSYLPDGWAPGDHGLSLALNNSTTLDIKPADKALYPEHMPFVQTPTFAGNAVGEVSFKARLFALDKANAQKAEVAVYGAQITGGSAEDPELMWTPLARFTVDDTIYKEYRFRSPSANYCAFRFGVTGVKGVRNDERGEDPHEGPEPVRVMLDEIVVGEALYPQMGFRYVYPVRSGLDTNEKAEAIIEFEGGAFKANQEEQPLLGESWTLQAEVVAKLLPDEIDFDTPGHEPRVLVKWHKGESRASWGVANWADKVNFVELKPAKDEKLVFRGSIEIAPEAIVDTSDIEEGTLYAVYQYTADIEYWDKEGNRHTHSLTKDEWSRPEWYHNVDKNEGKGSFSPYTILETIAPQRAWINEVNVIDWASSNEDNFNNQYIEIAVPAAQSLEGWSLYYRRRSDSENELKLLCEFTDKTIGDGYVTPTKTTNVTNDYAFLAIRSPKTRESGIWPEGTFDGTWGYEQATDGSIDCSLPISFQLVRPSRIVEQEIALEGYNKYDPGTHAEKYSLETYVKTLNALETYPQCYAVGNERNNAGVQGKDGLSLGVIKNTGAVIEEWSNTMHQTPGLCNEGQLVPEDWVKLPNGVMLMVSARVVGSHVLQMVEGESLFTAEMLKFTLLKEGEGTNLVYKVAPWYELKSVTANKTTELPIVPGAMDADGWMHYTVKVGKNEKVNLSVVAETEPRKDLREQYGLDEKNRFTEAVMAWLESGATMRGDFAKPGEINLGEYYNLRGDKISDLSLTDMYWLDMDPTEGGWKLKAGVTAVKPVAKPVVTSRMKLAGIQPPEDNPDQPSVTTDNQNLRIKVKMTIANDDGVRSYAPYVLRDVKPGKTSVDFDAEESPAENWNAATFKITGDLQNGLETRQRWVPLRYFYFLPDFEHKANLSASFDENNEALIEVWDPFDPNEGPSGWDEYKGTPVFYSWSIDERNAPTTIEPLKPTSTY